MAQLNTSSPIKEFLRTTSAAAARAAIGAGEQSDIDAVITHVNGVPLKEVALSKWFNGGVFGKKICMVGDSTTAQLPATWLDEYTKPGGPLEGCTAAYLGYNGATTAVILTHIADIVAAAADLYVVSAGINDVRTGGVSASVLSSRIVQLIDPIRAGVPGTSIILRMPNPFLTTDVGGAGYVVPNASAQDYSAIMRDAYRSLVGYWPDAWLLDTQNRVFGETSLASSSMMSDQIHPSGTGYSAVAVELVADIGQPLEFARALAEAARADAATFPAGLYPESLLDPTEYELIGKGFAGTSGTYYEIRFDKLPDRPRRGDIIWNHGNTPFISAVAPSFQAYAGNRLLYRWLGQTPPAWTQGNATEVYRPRYYYHADIRSALLQNPPRKLWVRIGSAGTNFIDVSAADAGLNASAVGGISEINTGDILAIQGYGNLALTGATFGAQSVNSVRISITGAWAPYANQNALLYNTAPPGGKKARRVRSGVAVTVNTAVQPNDDVIEADTTSNAITLPLPIVANVPGMTVTAKKVAGSNVLQFQAAGADLIDGAATLAVTTWATIRANTAGTAWHQIG